MLRRNTLAAACNGLAMSGPSVSLLISQKDLRSSKADSATPATGMFGSAAELGDDGDRVLNDQISRTLLEEWRLAQRASVGLDPDAIAYLDAVERTEIARAAYQAEVDEAELLTEERRATLVGVAAEVL